MRERRLKVATAATLTCPNCSKRSRLKVPADSTIYSFECGKCKSKIETPPARCCIICTYTKKKCTPAVKMHNNLIDIRKARKTK
jgi:Zn ribbon nucleic-acid-binding protein